MAQEIYEWDENKNQLNIHKHGIDFNIACKVFEDPFALYLDDDEHSFGELRYIVIGMVEKIMFVVCTDKGNDTTRIISARYANKQEQEIYYGNNN